MRRLRRHVECLKALCLPSVRLHFYLYIHLHLVVYMYILSCLHFLSDI